ncbi:hypothetical protein PtA15_10A121 [Puccinia triticina]|uniref:Uncharacterized protein n=1 Tax=Puccinia triticina TaxID=208348 RepID=A0ABY7CW75_9BASI|nr:uncharacterized protein PtA15_10A121 [Puccinia triticina]WAQ88702.1 hypothetical protein PtA15_10A121 [Puccinia triticina]
MQPTKAAHRKDHGTRAPPPPPPAFNPFLLLNPTDPQGARKDPGHLPDDPVILTPNQQLYADFGVRPVSEELLSRYELPIQMPEADRSGLVLALLTAILQHQGAAGPNGPPDQAPAQAPIPLSHADRELMRSAARDAMMIANVDAYAGDNRERSVFRMVTAALRAQPKAYIRADFPPQFLQEDRLALSHVHTEVRRQVKNVRHLVRNHALTGVVLGHSHMVLLVIPILDVWTLLVVQKDHLLFGMSPLLAALDRDNCTCPTVDEVNIQVGLMA